LRTSRICTDDINFLLNDRQHWLDVGGILTVVLGRCAGRLSLSGLAGLLLLFFIAASGSEAKTLSAVWIASAMLRLATA